MGEISIDVIVYCCQTIQFRYNIGRYWVYYAKFKMFEKWNLFHQVDNDCDIFLFLSVVYLPTLHIWKNTTPCHAEIKAGVQFLEWGVSQCAKIRKEVWKFENLHYYLPQRLNWIHKHFCWTILSSINLLFLDILIRYLWYTQTLI